MKASKLPEDGLQNAVWLRRLLLAFFVIVWMLVVRSYPVYFQRDDSKELYWSQHHSYIQAFIPTKENALWVDPAYRPLRELGWLCQYKLFGLNSQGYHFMLGVLLILTFVFLFKLTARISNYATAYMMVFIWLGGFQFLLTNLFWFTDLPHILEMLLISAGLYLFISGLGRSLAGVIAGLALVVLAFFAKEPAIIIGPVAVSVYLATQGTSRFRWGARKTILWSVLALLAGPAYLAVFPYVLHRQAAGGPAISAAVGEALTRFHFYSQILTSGITGVALLVPAVYYLAVRMTLREGKVGSRFPVYLTAALVIALVIAKGHLSAIGILVLLGGALAMERTRYFLLPWAYLPFVGLCTFSSMGRTYLYEASFSLSILAAIQVHALLRDLTHWWKERISSRAVSYAAVGLVVVLGVGMSAVKIKNRAGVLRLRSDMSMSVKSITPLIERLPKGSTLTVVDYESMGWEVGDAMRLPDEEKVRIQSPMTEREAYYWLRVVGKEDLNVVNFGEYLRNAKEYRRRSRVFLWLQTQKDHEFIAKLGLATRSVSSIKQGDAKMDIIEL